MAKKNKEVKKALKEEKGTGSHYDGYTVKDYKRDNKKAVKKALKEEKGTGSDYDGYTFKDYKRDQKGGAETKSERIAGEVEDGLRKPGGKKKPNYKKRKKKLLKGYGNYGKALNKIQDGKK